MKDDVSLPCKDPLERLLAEPPSPETHVMDFLLLAGLERAINYEPPSYVASKRPDLRISVRERCESTRRLSPHTASRLVKQLWGVSLEGYPTVGDLYGYFCRPFKSHIGVTLAGALNNMLVEYGLPPVQYAGAHLRDVNARQDGVSSSRKAK
jgi:hypothetical protein